MWIGTAFPTDTNAVLKDIQFRLYGEMLLRLYGRPRESYLNACRLVQVETDFAIRLQRMDSFDHRTLQDTHDLIAAWFRFSKDDGGQLRLGEAPASYEERLTVEWRAFFEEEITRLSLNHEFTRAILTAAAYGNTEEGYAAEGQLREILKARYQAMTQQPQPCAIAGPPSE